MVGHVGSTRRLVITIILCLTVAGCGRNSSLGSPASVVAPSPGHQMRDRRAGVYFYVPAGYQEIDSQARLDSIFHGREGSANQVPRYQADEVLAVDPVSLDLVKGGYDSRIKPGTLDPARLQAALVAQYSSAGATKVDLETTTVNGSPAPRFSYYLKQHEKDEYHVIVMITGGSVHPFYYFIEFVGNSSNPTSENLVLSSFKFAS